MGIAIKQSTVSPNITYGKSKPKLVINQCLCRQLILFWWHNIVVLDELIYFCRSRHCNFPIQIIKCSYHFNFLYYYNLSILKTDGRSKLATQDYDRLSHWDRVTVDLIRAFCLLTYYKANYENVYANIFLLYVLLLPKVSLNNSIVSFVCLVSIIQPS
jgi:hypothetical protein